MEFFRAFTYSFDDREWLSKLAIVTILTFSTFILMPMLFLGFLPLCILLGYMVEIVRNVRDNKTVILPRWDNFGDLLNRGFGVLVAVIVYNAPLVIMSFCLFSSGGITGDDIIGGFLTLGTLCCLTPIIIIYALVAYPMFAIGFIRYMDRGKISDFFDVGYLFNGMTEMGGYTVQWILMGIGANIILGFVGAIPCIGWLVAGALMIPVQAHLLGQYAKLRDEHKNKGKPKIVEGR